MCEELIRQNDALPNAVQSQVASTKEERINRIKEHILDRGVDRFDPNLGIARAWQRLEKGIHHENDIQLLKHGYFESQFERIFKTNYKTAHRKTVDSKQP
ncbi:hypothetical protein QUF99_08580 [Bacillus sp. DX4.1]|uniref:hypothetical protein n=1 Tax=Bacillus sp. DX4.1 TaxID=3055867 RepID=UPI0025A15543|nr:hypothetical protein [Bacillus sp. DX4.1]MDM5187372.1 hypothetical protein [Bacillus sp. DX4.1]